MIIFFHFYSSFDNRMGNRCEGAGVSVGRPVRTNGSDPQKRKRCPV